MGTQELAKSGGQRRIELQLSKLHDQVTVETVVQRVCKIDLLACDVLQVPVEGVTIPYNRRISNALSDEKKSLSANQKSI